MSPTSYQLLYPAMLDCKGKNILIKCKIFLNILTIYFNAS